MATFTYATLTSNIQAFLEDDSTEVSNSLDTIIGLGEEKLLKDLQPLVARKIGTGSTGTSATFAHALTDIVVPRFLSITTTGTTTVLLRRKDDTFLREYWPDAAVTGTPKYWTEQDDTTIRLAPTPSSSFTWELGYTYRPTGLSSGNTTSWLGTNAGTALRWACMTVATQFLKLEGVDTTNWAQNYTDALASARMEQQKMRLRDNSQYGDAE